MENTIVIIGIIFILLLTLFFVIKTIDGNKAKKNYVPPVAKEKTVLPDFSDPPSPPQSGHDLRFCSKCGSVNMKDASNCTKCGAKL